MFHVGITGPRLTHENMEDSMIQGPLVTPKFPSVKYRDSTVHVGFSFLCGMNKIMWNYTIPHFMMGHLHIDIHL